MSRKSVIFTNKKRDIVEFVVAEMKLSPVDDGFDQACENYVKLQLRIGKKTELNAKLKAPDDANSKPVERK